jgi:hypothetical protein
VDDKLKFDGQLTQACGALNRSQSDFELAVANSSVVVSTWHHEVFVKQRNENPKSKERRKNDVKMRRKPKQTINLVSKKKLGN